MMYNVSGYLKERKEINNETKSYFLGQYQLLHGENWGQDDDVFCVPREKARQGC